MNKAYSRLFCEKTKSDCFMLATRHSHRPLHYHDCIEMAYIVQGSITHFIVHPDGHEETYVLSEGDYIILDYGILHSYQDGSPDFLIINFLFKPGLIRRELKTEHSLMSIISTPPFNFDEKMFDDIPTNKVLHDDDKVIYKIFKKALSVYNSQKFGYMELLHNYAVETILFSMQRFLINDPVIKENKIISQIQDYVALHYSEPITLTQICHNIFFSMPYISKKFKEVCGISFERYLQEVRIRNACELLMETNQSIADIAILVGYNDPSSFRKVFFKLTGLKPFDFRKQYQHPPKT